MDYHINRQEHISLKGLNYLSSFVQSYSSTSFIMKGSLSVLLSLGLILWGHFTEACSFTYSHYVRFLWLPDVIFRLWSVESNHTDGFPCNYLIYLYWNFHTIWLFGRSDDSVCVPTIRFQWYNSIWQTNNSIQSRKWADSCDLRFWYFSSEQVVHRSNYFCGKFLLWSIDHNAIRRHYWDNWRQTIGLVTDRLLANLFIRFID